MSGYWRNGDRTESQAHIAQKGYFRILLPTPIPPTAADKRRIVARVYQLMALLEQLVAQLDQSRTAAQHLVAELTAA
jgi:hypothetical protein